ncbi:NAD-dependent epimerase/dehydratase family protein [Lacibacter luteus]|uniref:NAD-dependent epimerase/dehydratase family protein n=1 Tax=Lacibacter luteus TaxID=2508719 RepID=A0A4Q1CNK5_9BACT|nr:NAD(P)H-binding protein [Lacibacter luteus]RXK62673.1 NAD-dependent epimerase/dehydratase family protein [Lacibacter luteus]
MNGQTAVVIGATGLVGSALVEQLLNDDAFSRVRILVRRAVNLQHPKLEICITDFSNYEHYQQQLGTGDCIFCCIGTTMAQVKGDKVLYRSIDFDIPVNAARFGKAAGFQQYLLVSAIGANSRSRFFYTRLKGEVEEVIATFGFNSFHIFRPSFLMGNRMQHRTGESIGITLFRMFKFLLPSNYKGINGTDVANAMLLAAKKKESGLHVYAYSKMLEKA